ncbi:MAG: chromate transporter [Lentisphaerae bacterium]|jgi:chromate transporter|nr:chromate transporter [Lentisphaerota bacterium]
MSDHKKVTLGMLYRSFAGVGAVLFGGGYAMLPLLEREVVERRKWYTHQEMSDLYALAQVIPGVIAVNTAILVGHRYRGAIGATIAALGMISAPTVVMITLATSYATVTKWTLFTRLFDGLRPSVAGLLLAVAIRMIQRGCKSRWEYGIATAACIAAAGSLLGPLGLILSGIAIGIIWHLWAKRQATKMEMPQ